MEIKIEKIEVYIVVVDKSKGRSDWLAKKIEHWPLFTLLLGVGLTVRV